MNRIKKYDLNMVQECLWDSILEDPAILKSKTPCEFKDKLFSEGMRDPGNRFATDLEQQMKNPIPQSEVIGFFISNQHPLFTCIELSQ